MTLSRRAILACLTAFLWPNAVQAAPKAKELPRRTNHSSHHLKPTVVPRLTGNPLPIPPILDVSSVASLELKVETVTHAFIPGQSTEIVGYNGSYPGPTLRLKRGETITARLLNALDRPTNLHWHGLRIESGSDGALSSVASGGSWDVPIRIDQPAATLWYHEQRPDTPGLDRPLGMLLIGDQDSATSGLPSTYGVDDFPLILEDPTFDADGKPIGQPTATSALIGTRGKTILVNGIIEPLLKVPQRLVRLRILNAARARVFRLFMDDERSFYLIAGDGGFVQAPVEIDTLILAPGERAEILVDFADGSTSLLSTPDAIDVATDGHVEHFPDSFEKPFRVIAFEAEKDAIASRPLPSKLPAPTPFGVPNDAKRRQFELRVARDSASTTGVIATINGKSFDPARQDIVVKRGEVEIWQFTTTGQAMPIHISGAEIYVRSASDTDLAAWNQSAKDTIFIETSIEIAVRFPYSTSGNAPYLILCTQPELAADGLIATVVGD